MATHVKALHDYIVVKRIEEPPSYVSAGVILAGKSNEGPAHGRVISVGEGELLHNGTLRPLAVHVGDEVLFAPFNGAEVRVDGEALVIMHERDIIGVVSP